MLQLRYHDLEIIAGASQFYLIFFKHSQGHPEFETGIYFFCVGKNLGKVNSFLISVQIWSNSTESKVSQICASTVKINSDLIISSLLYPMSFYEHGKDRFLIFLVAADNTFNKHAPP